jgi:tetratricopeptide (TPR) repeat protein
MSLKRTIIGATSSFLFPHRLIILFLGFALILLISGIVVTANAGDQSPPVSLSLQEQERLAEELYAKMAKTDQWDLDTFIKLHRQVIQQCPDTKRAQESIWRLSNLYLIAVDPPDNQKTIELMELLIKSYPNSPLIPNARKRLLVSYKETGNFSKVVELYDEAFSHSPEALGDPDMTASILEYADALARTGNTEKARMLYQKVISFGDKIEDWLLDIAKDKISRTGKQ